MKSTRRGFIRRFMTGLAGGVAWTGFSGRSRGAEEGNPASTKALPIRNEVDICVLGGSATGVFAAVRAARLGARVALVERTNGFGGVATGALVNVWHPLYDTEFNQKIIGGLTEETIARLDRRNAVLFFDKNPSVWAAFNSPELKIELDELVVESKITPYLHTLFSEPYYENGELSGVILDGKEGRWVLKAKYFIDATGDGDLCRRIGCGVRVPEHVQPPTYCAHLSNFDLTELNQLLKEHGEEFHIPSGFTWGIDVAGTESFMLAGTRIYGVNPFKVDDLTRGEIEGRRQIRAMMDLLRHYSEHVRPAKDDDPTASGVKKDSTFRRFGLTALASTLGIRQTCHIDALYRVTDDDALYGRRFPDAIANGSYAFDFHCPDRPGNIFRYLDGTMGIDVPGEETVEGRWRPETAENPTFYQFPLRSIIPRGPKNVLMAGRMFDAEPGAFSGMRVMVNMNQLGEAAGTCAFLALDQNKTVPEVDPSDVRRVLADGGSVVL